MNNVNDVRQELVNVVRMVRRSPKNIRAAKAIAGACGKILSSVSLQICYSKARGEKPEVKFLEASK